MKNKILLSFGILSFLLVGCSSNTQYSSSNPLDPTSDSTSPSVEPTLDKLEFIYDEESDSYGVKEKDIDVKGEIVIPDMYNDKYVTFVINKTFNNMPNVTSISFEMNSHIKTLPACLYHCSHLKELYLPNSLECVYNDEGIVSFAGNSVLSMTVYDKAYYIGSKNNPYLVLYDADKSFDDTNHINPRCKIINSCAFDCQNLINLYLPNAITDVCEYAFAYSFNIKTINIPESLKYLYGDSFVCNSSIEPATIEQYIVNENNPYFTVMDGDLYNKDKTILYGYLATKSNATFDIPQSVDVIVKFAFLKARNLEHVSFHGTKILERAFASSNLSSIDFGDKLEVIGDYAFPSNEFTSLTFPETTISIGDGAFSGCEFLEQVNLNERISYLGDYCFGDCVSLKEISLPSSLSAINGSLFNRCSNLESIVIPDKVERIGSWAFFECEKLSSVYIPNSVSLIESEAFGWCYSLKDIDYGGTKDEWNSIEKEQFWNDDVHYLTIHCTDGNISYK